MILKQQKLSDSVQILLLPILEWTKYARLALHVTVYDTGRSSFAGPFKKKWGHKLRVYPLLQAPLHHWVGLYHGHKLRICSPDLIREPLILHSSVLPDTEVLGDAVTKRLIGT